MPIVKSRGRGVTDWLRIEGQRDLASVIADAPEFVAPPEFPEPTAVADDTKGRRHIRLTPASAITPKPVHWLWRTGYRSES